MLRVGWRESAAVGEQTIRPCKISLPYMMLRITYGDVLYALTDPWERKTTGKALRYTLICSATELLVSPQALGWWRLRRQTQSSTFYQWCCWYTCTAHCHIHAHQLICKIANWHRPFAPFSLSTFLQVTNMSMRSPPYTCKAPAKSITWYNKERNRPLFKL